LYGAGEDKKLTLYLDGFHPKTWNICHNWEKLLKDINNCRNLKEVFWGEVQSNYSEKNNGFVEGSGEIKNLKTRTMIIHGSKDGTIPVEHADYMAGVIGCRYERLEGLEHFTWHDNCDLTISLVKDFLSTKHFDDLKTVKLSNGETYTYRE